MNRILSVMYTLDVYAPHFALGVRQLMCITVVRALCWIVEKQAWSQLFICPCRQIPMTCYYLRFVQYLSILCYASLSLFHWLYQYNANTPNAQHSQEPEQNGVPSMPRTSDAVCNSWARPSFTVTIRIPIFLSCSRCSLFPATNSAARSRCLPLNNKQTEQGTLNKINFKICTINSLTLDKNADPWVYTYESIVI